MIRAVLYLRSSKDRSDVSIDAQRRALQELAQVRGFLIVGEYADAVESGKDDDRPGFQSLLRAIRSERTWDHILVLDTARIARRRALAIIFEEQECKKRGVRVVYKSLPESDPITEMLLKSILQAMDEWHSLTSKVKGMAGMAENVRQGWRAGGRAPKGYNLQYKETGAIRDGAAVTKSKLIPSDDAVKVRAYLQHRAKGTPRSRSKELSGVDWPTTTLIEIERNALTYAGHTVWNRSAERQGNTYVGGTKWKPRSEWVIQKNTHDALISDAEAETILEALEVKKMRHGAAKHTYLLSGILFSPSGQAWVGDSGTYRLGKGVRIKAESVEEAIVSKIKADLQADDMATDIAAHYKAIASKEDKSDTQTLKRRIAEIDKKTSRLADLMSETTAGAALLRQIEALEVERDRLVGRVDEEETNLAQSKALKNLTPGDVKRIMAEILDRLSQEDASMFIDALRSSVDKIELSAESFEATIYYRFGSPVKKTGEKLASPRGTVLYPGFAHQSKLLIRHNRRRAL